MNELLVGYARVSTEEQDLTAQRNALAALGFGADRIYADQGGGHALMHERPELLVALVSDWLDRTRPDNN
jgi:DNA invertase Pin-like site-specific DNA recombinase